MDDPTLVLFGQRMRRARKARRWSARILAAEVGRPQSSIYGYEKGRVDPGLTVAKRIADVLGVTLDGLLAGPGHDGDGAR